MSFTVRRLKSQWFQVVRRLKYGLPHKANKPGTARWLAAKEQAYGGYHRNVPRHKVGRSLDGSAVPTGGMIGGDRMGSDLQQHAYGPFYEKMMHSFIGRPITLVEVGILRGVGLAIWSDLFPNGKIVGLDLDPSHFHGNVQKLRERGAFSSNNVSVYEFDQVEHGSDNLEKIFEKSLIDVVIDDGMHTRHAIKNTFESMRPFLKKDYLYIVEDSHDAVDVLPFNRTLHRVIQQGEICAVFPRRQRPD